MHKERSDQKVVVTQYFDASAEEVFDAWFDNDLLAVWMFDPNYRQQRAIELKLSPVVGGGFNFRIRRDGRELTYLGEYLVIQRPYRSQMTWSLEGSQCETLVSVEIAPCGSGCKLVLEHDLGRAPEALAQEIEANWQADFSALARTLH